MALKWLDKRKPIKIWCKRGNIGTGNLEEQSDQKLGYFIVKINNAMQ